MTFFRDISIRRKLLFAFGTIVLLSALVEVVALAINLEIRTDISQIRQAGIEEAESVSTMAESLLALKWHWQELVTERYRVGPSGQKQGGADQAKITQAIFDSFRQFEEQGVGVCRQETIQAIELAKSEGHPNEIRDAETEPSMLDGIEAKFTLLKKHIQNDLAGREPNSTSKADSARYANDFDQVSSLVEGYETHVKDQLKREVRNIQRSLYRANLILLSFALLVLAISSFLTWFISRMISHPIEVLKDSAQRIGQGDLQTVIDIPSQDEFGLLAKTFNQMTHDLQATTVSKNYVDSILKSMVNALIVLRPDHTIQSVNEATLQLLGYTSSDLVGQPMDLVLKTPSTRPKPVLDEIRDQEFVSEIEVGYEARDGRLIPMTFSASTLHNSVGVVTGLVCVAQDISPRKQAERELVDANRHLLETSRQAGMAEVATSVLHNVGNVLNSVNVSSALISEKVQNSKISNLTRAMALLEEHQTDMATFLSADAKGKQLPGYLSKLTVNLVHEQKEILEEATSLVKNILHIREIVAMQQNYARVSGVTELFEPRELMEDAVRINTGSLERHQVKLVREYAEVPPILLEKHKILQILVNLLRNAKYACDDSGKTDKQIILRIAREDGRIQMSVSDNGVGIPTENLSRIFGHGFTTRKEGHGFGLHSGALTAQELGGSLTAFSEGPGQGATFVLELPMSPASHEN